MRTRAEHLLKDVDNYAIVKPNVAPAFDAGVAALYTENGSAARAIMDWRHKVVMLYVLTLGASGSCWLWLYDHHREGQFPLIGYAIAFVALVLGVMDGTIAAILRECYCVGAEIEQRVLEHGGIYAALKRRRQSRRTFTYTRILGALYFGTSALFFIAATVLRVQAIR